jgi:hypothetical protein
MQAAIEISMEDTDTLNVHYQPTNDISEEALALIKAWEESFSKPGQKFESNYLDQFTPTDLSQPPQRYRRHLFTPRKMIKTN